MQTLATVFQKTFPGKVLRFENIPFIGDPTTHKLVGTCGPQVPHEFVSDGEVSPFFLQAGGSFVMGVKGPTGVQGPTLCAFGDLRFDAQMWLLLQGGTVPTGSHRPMSAFQFTQVFVFSKATNHLAEKLHMNPHFPVDERELLPPFLQTSADRGGDFGTSSSTIEEINCFLDCVKSYYWRQGILTTYSQKVPKVLQSLKCVCVTDTTATHGTAATAVPTWSSLKTHFQAVFGGVGTAHTLTLRSCSHEFVCGTVGQNLQGISRLVLDGCNTVDFNALLLLIAKNAHLEEVCFKSNAPTFNVATLELVRKCPHVTFLEDPTDLSLPPPKAAAKIPQPVLQKSLPLKEFDEQFLAGTESPGRKNGKKTKDKPRTHIGLLTAYGEVVPLDRKMIPRFELLQAMLDDTDDDDAETKFAPVKLDPPVGQDSLALAVHFVTHFVSEEIHLECQQAENDRQYPSEVAASTAGGGTGTLPLVTYTWCSAFDQFRTTHIQQAYSTSARRIQIMCELMAVAVFLNCPSLKRFLRAALVLEEQQSSASSGDDSQRGKRNRTG